MSLRVSMLDESYGEPSLRPGGEHSWLSSSPAREARNEIDGPEIVDSSLQRESINYSEGSRNLADLKAYEKGLAQMQQNLQAERLELLQRKKKAEKIISKQIEDSTEYDQQMINKILSDTERAKDLIDSSSLNFLEIEIQNIKNDIKLLEASNAHNRSKFNLSPSKKHVSFSPTKPKQFVSEMEELFDKAKVKTQAQDTDERITKLCDTIQRRNLELKEEKLRIKHLEETNKRIREEMEEKYKEQQNKIQELELIMANQEKSCQQLQTTEEELMDLKSKLDVIKKEKDQIKRQNQTILKDKLYQASHLKQIESIQESIAKKKKEIKMSKSILESQKNEVMHLSEEVRNKELMLQKYEQKVIEMEKEVNLHSECFSNTIEEAKKEIDSLTHSFSRTSATSNSIEDDIADIFNENDENDGQNDIPDSLPKPNFSPRLSHFTPYPIQTNMDHDNSYSQRYNTEMFPSELLSISPSKQQQQNVECMQQSSPYMEELINLFS